MSVFETALSVGDGVVTGIEDGVMSWFDNDSKQEEVRQAARQLELLANDLKNLDNVVQSIVNASKEVYQGVLVQQEKVTELIHWDASGPVLDGMMIGARFGWFASAAAGTAAGGATLAAGVSSACTALGKMWTAATAPTTEVANAGVQIEMRFLNQVAEVGEVTRVVETASFATKAMNFAKVAGKVAMAAMAVAAILQTVVGGIVRAELRNQAHDLMAQIDEIRQAFPQAKEELKGTVDALQEHYFRLAPVDPATNKHYVDDKTQRFFVEDFLADINSLYDVADRQDATDTKAFDDLVAKISTANGALRIGLVDALTQSTVGVALAADAVTKAIDLLRAHIPMNVVQGVYTSVLADETLRNSVQAFVDNYPSSDVKPQLKMDGQGHLTVEAAQ
jgi:hypothetical protein